MTRNALCIGFMSFGLALGGNAHAEEPLQDYVYYPDGTYSKTDDNMVGAGGPSRFAGFIESSVGVVSQGGETGFVTGLRGSIGTNVFEAFHLQGDVSYREAIDDGLLLGSSIFGTVHAGYRPNNNFIVGGFLRAGEIGYSGISQNVESLTYGAEVAYLMDQATVYARVGQLTESFGAIELEEILLNGGVNFYAQDNMRFDASGTVVGDFMSLKLTGNYRGGWGNGTFFGGYEVQSNDVADESHHFFAGYRYNFGSDTLKGERDAGLVWASFD